MTKDVEFDLTSSDSGCNDSFSRVQNHLCHIFLLYNLFLRVLRLYFNPHRMCGSEGLFSSLHDNGFQRFRVKKTWSRIVHLDPASSQTPIYLFRPHITQTQSSVCFVNSAIQCYLKPPSSASGMQYFSISF